MDYRKIYAIKRSNQNRILKVCPNCPNTSGIYFLLREENGFRFGYIGKAKHLLDRLGSHLSGYQYIDLSIKKHGLFSEQNPFGYRVHYLEYPEEKLDEMEQYYIKKYANAGYRLRNIESGGTSGKTDIGERRQGRGYYDGVEAGYKKARKEISHLFSLHLDFSTKKTHPNKLQEKAFQKFKDFLEVDDG